MANLYNFMFAINWTYLPFSIKKVPVIFTWFLRYSISDCEARISMAECTLQTWKLFISVILKCEIRITFFCFIKKNLLDMVYSLFVIPGSQTTSNRYCYMSNSCARLLSGNGIHKSAILSVIACIPLYFRSSLAWKISVTTLNDINESLLLFK